MKKDLIVEAIKQAIMRTDQYWSCPGMTAEIADIFANCAADVIEKKGFLIFTENENGGKNDASNDGKTM